MREFVGALTVFLCLAVLTAGFTFLAWQQGKVDDKLDEALCSIRDTRERAYNRAEAINLKIAAETGEQPSELGKSAQQERRELIDAFGYLDCPK